ncbi:ATP-binding protein [Yinghuangia soli]|uniref:ATP-binding protein n=1 Tax=Yinghuangia soli TaxID=2908204 RepID=A0AA41TZW1_9ACTN|nr:ATP-binding protein [Yinghuangia soli]MCF2527926.1 ATP-binding protein [Yinghuangia soli]
MPVAGAAHPAGPWAVPVPLDAHLVLRTHGAVSRTVRRFAATVLEAWQHADLIDDTEVIVSELVGNVLRHTDSSHLAVSLRVQPEGTARGTLLGSVADCSPKLPGMRTADEGEEDGRGLSIVDRLAKEWGARGTGCGKEVWFRLAAGPVMT